MAAKKVNKKQAKTTEAKKAPAPKRVSLAAKGPELSIGSAYTQTKSDVEKNRALSALRNQLGDKLIPAHMLENVYDIKRPTGIISVDIALGGGFPAGGACMLSGPFNSGKTWTLFRSMAMQQQLFGHAFKGALHIAETQVPYDQMRQAGMKVAVPDSVLSRYIQRDLDLGLPMWPDEVIADWKTQVGHIEFISGGTGEDVLQTVLECVKANVFSLIGVDSISSLLPQRDADKDMDDESARAARAMMMQKFWEKYVPHVNKGTNTTSLVFTQQVRANDSQYGKEWKVTGGKASEHYKLIDLALWAGSQLRRTINGVDYVVGKKTLFETLKGKAGTHDHIKGEFNFYYPEFFPGSVDVHGDLILLALQQGILQQTNKGLQLVRGITHEPMLELSAPNDMAFRELLAHDFELELKMRREVLAAAGIKCDYR